MVLILSLMSLAVWCGLAERATSGVVGDASVTHRLALWKGALQMAADHPWGYGRGQSGEQYMQWYQPLDHSEGYRTMVNSYLTLLVEQGWLLCGVLCMLFIAFWQWSAPRGEMGEGRLMLILALRAAILAFLVAGLFSTTMENVWLWILPMLCVVSLVVLMSTPLRRFSENQDRLHWSPLFASSAGLTLLLLWILWTLGGYFSSRDPVIRSFAQRDGHSSVSAVSPRHPRVSIRLLPDPLVLGDLYGKLVRSLALRVDAKVTLAGTEPVDLLMATGTRCFEQSPPGSRGTLWIAPPVPTPEEIAMMEAITSPKKLLIPDIDEDGRSLWWKNHSFAQTQMIPLEGVGTRSDWAWNQVVALVQKHYSSR